MENSMRRTVDAWHNVILQSSAFSTSSWCYCCCCVFCFISIPISFMDSVLFDYYEAYDNGNKQRPTKWIKTNKKTNEETHHLYLRWVCVWVASPGIFVFCWCCGYSKRMYVCVCVCAYDQEFYVLLFFPMLFV